MSQQKDGTGRADYGLDAPGVCVLWPSSAWPGSCWGRLRTWRSVGLYRDSPLFY